MAAPALAALARLLPLLAGEGGTAAALGGGAAAEGGIGATLGRLFGGVQAFTSEAELGGALRKISDLQGTIEAAQQAMAQKSQEQQKVAHKAREDERQFAFSDPAHTKQLAELAREHQAQQESMRQAQRQMGDLRARAAVTTDPSAARAASWGRAAGVIGAGATVASFAPTIARNLPGVQAAQNLGGAAVNLGAYGAGPTNTQIIGQMAGTAGAIGGAAMGGAQRGGLVGGVMGGPMGAVGGAAIGGLVGSAAEIAKLPGRIQSWGEALVESQRGISRFNGTLAMTFAEQERRGTIRGIESGQRTGGSTSELSSSLQDLYDTIQPMRDSVTIVLAKGMTEAVKLLTTLAKELTELRPFLDMMAQKFLGMSEKQYKEFLESFAALQRAQQARAGSQIGRALEEAMGRDKSKRIGTTKR